MQTPEQVNTINPVGYLKNGKYFSFEQMQGETNDESDIIQPLYSMSVKESQPQQIGEWISVKDKLPEEKVKVLICLMYGSGREEIQTSYYVKRTKSFDHFMNDIITHWMPLPSPPKNKNKFKH